MKSGKQYRFSLSWNMDTDDKILAGELLENMGYKKSAFIIQLISDYVAKNPEAIDRYNTIKFVINSNSKLLEDMISDAVKAEIATGKYALPPQKTETEVIADISNELTNDNGEIATMLGNLDAWG